MGGSSPVSAKADAIGASELAGIRVSAGLLVAFGCLLGLYALMFTLTLGFHVDRSSHHSLPILGVVTILIGFAWLCLRAAAALYNGRRWGAYVAMMFGSLLLIFVGILVYDMHHPKSQSPDEYFAIVIAPFLCAVGLWWCVYLNLPRVRTRLRGKSADQLTT